MNHIELKKRGFDVPDHIHVVVKHIRPEDPRLKDGPLHREINSALDFGAKWATRAIFKNDAGEVLGSGVSYCNPKDNPCRKTGWIKAVGRAYGDMQYNLETAESEYRVYEMQRVAEDASGEQT